MVILDFGRFIRRKKARVLLNNLALFLLFLLLFLVASVAFFMIFKRFT